MAGRHEGVPRGGSLTLRKTGLLELLRTIDESPESRYRVLSMECEFRHKPSNPIFYEIERL